MKQSIKVLLIVLLISKSLVAQQVPNGDFETWQQSGNYMNPQFWDTPNDVTASLGIFTVTRESSIVQNGSYSLKLQSKSVFGSPIPGLATLGDFSINLFTMQATITGGYPFTYKPVSLSGYYQYEPVFGDEAFVGVLLLRQSGNIWDTIADGNFTTTQQKLSWTPFTITLNYRNNDDPTHLNIIILSSDRNNPQPNSTLYIDNLQFSYPTSIYEMENPSAIVTYKDNHINVSLRPSLSLKIVEVYSLQGQLIARHLITVNSESYQFPLTLHPSMYMVRLIFNDHPTHVSRIYVY